MSWFGPPKSPPPAPFLSYSRSVCVTVTRYPAGLVAQYEPPTTEARDFALEVLKVFERINPPPLALPNHVTVTTAKTAEGGEEHGTEAPSR